MFCTTFSGSVKRKQVLHGLFAYFVVLGRHFPLLSISLPYIFALCSSICLHLNDTSNTLKALCHVLSMFSSSCPASILTSLTKEFLLDRELIRLTKFHQISADCLYSGLALRDIGT